MCLKRRLFSSDQRVSCSSSLKRRSQSIRPLLRYFVYLSLQLAKVVPGELTDGLTCLFQDILASEQYGAR